MIGMRHEKTNDLSFQNEHDGSVAHKTKNKVPFDSTKVNVMYTYDKEGNEKRTEYYRMKFKQDWVYAEKYLQTGKLELEDMKFAKNTPEQDKIRRYEYLKDLFNKLDKDKLRNGLDNFKNAPELSKWYKQQEKNKRQSAKKTHGKAEHKSLQPFMTNVIFFGKEDLELGNNMNKDELDKRVKSFVSKFQEKYSIPKESIRISRHEDETSTHFHYTFLNWNEKTKHFNNKEMSSPHIIQEHLDMLENEFKDVLVKTRTKYTESKKERHKTLVEYNAELVSESKQVSAELNQVSNDVVKVKDELVKVNNDIVNNIEVYKNQEKKLIEVNKKLNDDNHNQTIELVHNMTNNKQVQIELEAKKKKEKELEEKILLNKQLLEEKKQSSLSSLNEYNKQIERQKNKLLDEAKLDLENQKNVALETAKAELNEEYGEIKNSHIQEVNKLKSENKKLESSIEINKAKLEELENNIDTIAEIKDSKVSVNTATMNNVAKYINGESEAKIILLLNKIEKDHNIKIDYDKRDEYRKEAQISKDEVLGSFEKYVVGFKETLGKLSAMAKKVLTFGFGGKGIDDIKL